MTPAWNELPVSLDKLDGHLKAMLRLKIREFVHLSPWFKNIPSLEPTTYVNSGTGKPHTTRHAVAHRQAVCPHRKHGGQGRRIVRGSLHLTGIL